MTALLKYDSTYTHDNYRYLDMYMLVNVCNDFVIDQNFDLTRLLITILDTVSVDAQFLSNKNSFYKRLRQRMHV